ncbi:hypothetical protein OsJ_35384 [Oryza sativa Japonica Group]|uniref:Uncharacterized protein n=1 Tax=Oryza sativa subsp. japonica TaxID=39947 RepID=B9GC39_ORYSJ|nr:hypothetical protein OsJ_35384 [Oryza sativa Japonica Group]
MDLAKTGSIGGGGGGSGGGRRQWWRRARRIWRWRPQRDCGSLTPPSSSPHDGANELADGVASLVAAGSPNRGVGSPDLAAGSSDDGEAAAADPAAASSEDGEAARRI